MSFLKGKRGSILKADGFANVISFARRSGPVPLKKNTRGKGSGNPWQYPKVSVPQPPGSPSLWYDLTDASTLYTDASRTTLVSATGQEVLGIADKGSEAQHLSATAGPDYTTGGVNGRDYCDFVGLSSEYLTPDSATLDFATNETKVIGLVFTMHVTALNDERPYHTSAGNIYTLRMLGEVPFPYVDAAAVNTTDLMTNGQNAAIILSHTATTGAYEIRRSYSATAHTGTVAQVTRTNIGFYLGGSGTAGQYFDGHIYDFIVYNATSGAPTLDDMEAWITAKYGITWT